jgi:hypothetical protein
MRNKLLLVGSMLIMVFIVLYACGDKKAADKSEKQTTTESSKDVNEGFADLVQRGNYLVGSMGCDDCHSPKKMGPNGPEIIPELRLSGYRHDGKMAPLDSNVIRNGWIVFQPDLTGAVGPWGASFAANLTPDETGIGGWTEVQFMYAIRHGIYKGLAGGRSLLPPMPWPAYKNLSDDDLKAIFAFLKSMSPVKNVVPEPMPLAAIH